MSIQASQEVLNLLEKLFKNWAAWDQNDSYYLRTLLPELKAHPDRGTTLEKATLRDIKRVATAEEWDQLEVIAEDLTSQKNKIREIAEILDRLFDQNDFHAAEIYISANIESSVQRLHETKKRSAIDRIWRAVTTALDRFEFDKAESKLTPIKPYLSEAEISSYQSYVKKQQQVLIDKTIKRDAFNAMIEEAKREEDERLRQIQLAEEERLNQIRLREEQRKKEEIEKKKQAERELIARNEFILLKSKYQIAWSEEDSPISNLNRILMKLEDKKVLSNEDEQWLKDNMYFPVLAIHYEHTSNLATAGSYWRRAGNPQRALDVTENIVSPDHYILTMRGGAYKDIKDYENATKCALAATEVAPNDYHPYNLLGAIYYQQGFPEKGDNYFQKAISLGAKPKDEEISIKSALNNSGGETRKLVAQFLLSKNSTRYEWAKFYLK